MNVAPGDLLVIKYRDLDEATAAYQVVAVYDEIVYYMRLGIMRVLSVHASVFDEESLEVTVLRL